MSELTAVIDTNILVSILKGSPKLSFIYDAFKKDKFKLAISDELLKEFSAVLYRPHLKIEYHDIKELFRLIKARAVRIKLPFPSIDICRDPEDNFILEIALEAKADFIVSGDKDLLVLKSFRGIPIITPREFFACLKK